MLGKIFGFIGKWLGYLILILIGIAFLKNCVFAPENHDTLEYRWGVKLDRKWNLLGGNKYSEKPPFYSPQENIKCLSILDKDWESTNNEQRIAEIYNSYLITESLKARATLIGGLYFGSGEEFRVNSVDSMTCESRHDLYFKNIDSREIKSY